MSDQGPLPSSANDAWSDLLAFANSIAAEYHDQEWRVILADTTDATSVLGDSRFGLAVLVREKDFRLVEETVETVVIDTTDVYWSDDDAVRYYVIVAEASGSQTAIILPAFLHHDQFDQLRTRANRAGEMHTHIRALDSGSRVTISHNNPRVFFDTP